MSEDELQSYCEFAIALAKEAGDIARRYFDYDTAVEIKADNSPLTIADTKINELVIQKVRATYPGMGVLGEEDSLKGDDPDGLLWVLDPIDGTIPYTLHIPIFTFCLALVKDGEPVIGVVYDIMQDRLYSAIKGRGVKLNDQSFRPDTSLTPMKMVEFERWPQASHDVSKQFKALADAGYHAPNYSSYAYGTLMVALRKLSGALYAGEKPWDVAASKVILGELGVQVTDLAGREQRYDQPINGALVAYPQVWQLLVSAT